MQAESIAERSCPPPFLLSVDLEDIRTMFEGGAHYPERVPANTERLLEFLAGQGVRCTFFVVGEVARRYPELVRRIAGAGHEIACHGAEHVALDHLDERSLRDDLLRAREDLARAGVDGVVGYRAPGGSLKASTRWAYAVLREQGFLYSSSVVAARNPIHGWPEFGPDRPRLLDGVWELPMTLSDLPGLSVPFLGGVYFRVLPFALIRRLFRRRLGAGHAALGYLHPFDIDFEQDRFVHPQIGGNPVFNWLMYRNRRGVFPRLERLIAQGPPVVPYAEYVETLA